MPGMKLEVFSGLIPRSSDRLLPPMAATEARNTKLLNGEVRGFRALREEADFSGGAVSPVRRAFRVVDNAGLLADTWLTFDTRDVDVLRSPIVNDGFDRYFWAGDGRPMMNTYARIENGDPGYFLGIPTPQNAPSVTPPAGTDETRAYVYTFVSAYGEEGQPSPPTVATGAAGQWDLSGIDTTVPDPTSRNITAVKIYRTVTGGTSSNFYYVDEIALGTATYADNVTSTTVAANNLLESTSWAGPPIDLEGFVVMPNGYLVGWKGRRLVMSEAYRPHAWPAEYELSTEFPIVGLVVWGSTLVIGTKSQPYFGQGNSPASFTMQKLDAVEPCLSRRGMVATTAGAYYPSINGLILANSSGAKVITQDILTKEEWATYNPQDIYAAQLGLQYIAFNSQNFGFIFNPTEPQTKLVELDSFDDIEGVETDRYSGNVLLLRNNRAMEWDPLNSERLNWRWQSKLYQFPEPLNFGAVRLNFLTGAEDQSGDITAEYGAYNVALFAAVPSGTAPDPGDPGDPLWANVVMLMKFDGTDAATAYTEIIESDPGTFYGNAQLDTAVQAGGTASLLLDGTGDAVQFGNNVGTDAAWQIGNNDEATIEAFIQFNTLPGVGQVWSIVNQSQQDVNSYDLEVVNNSGVYQLRIQWGFGVTSAFTMNPQPTTGVMYHVAATRFISGSKFALMHMEGNYLGSAAHANNPSTLGGVEVTVGAYDNLGSQVFTQEFDGHIDSIRLTVGANRYGFASYTVPDADYSEGGAIPAESGIERRGLNTLNGHALGGTPAQAIGLVPTWTEAEVRQPLGGSLLYPEGLLNFQLLAMRLIVKTGSDNVVRFDKVVYNEEIIRLPTGFKSDLWQFDLYGNTDLYSVQIGTTPRALKAV